MANALQIPGLFLQRPEEPRNAFSSVSLPGISEPQQALALNDGLPPLSFANVGLEALQSVVHQATLSTQEDPASGNLNQPVQQISLQREGSVSDGLVSSMSSREEGELTDASMGILPDVQIRGSDRKRKASEALDSDRPSKISIGLDESMNVMQMQRNQALHVVDTLLASGFPLDQLVKDIYGITKARRQQPQPIHTLPKDSHTRSRITAPVSTLTALPSPQSTGLLTRGHDPFDRAALGNDHTGQAGTARESTSAAIILPAREPKKTANKLAPRDPQAYRAQLEAFKKVKEMPIAKPTTPTRTALNKLDRAKLNLKIAKLKAENASRLVASPGPVTNPVPKVLTHSKDPAAANDLPVSTVASSASPAPGILSKERMSALDLIEDSVANEKSPVPASSVFTTPMGIDQEYSVVIEASSSEDSEDEGDDSDKLGELLSNIELLQARIAAKELRREHSSNSSAAQAGHPSSTDAISADSSRKSSRQFLGTFVDSPPTDTIAVLPNPVMDDAAAETNDSDSIQHDQDSTIKLESALADASAAVAAFDDDSATQAEPLVSTDMNSQGAGQEAASQSTTSDNESEDSAVRDDAAMSIDSGEYPTPDMWAESRRTQQTFPVDSIARNETESEDDSASMDLSRSSSDGNEVQLKTNVDDAVIIREYDAASDEQSSSGLADSDDRDDSEEEYDPTMAITVDDSSNEEEVGSGKSSTSRSPTPGSGWRLHPPLKHGSGVVIRDESGMQPTMEKVSVVTQTVPRTTLAPYESKLRFKPDEVFDPFETTS